jgi:hypothetical protein
VEAFEAAKLRAVDPDILLAHGHHAPAIFVPGTVDTGPQPRPPAPSRPTPVLGAPEGAADERAVLGPGRAAHA